MEDVVEQGMKNRIRGGFSPDVQSQHPLAQQWENIADASIKPIKAELFQKPYGKEADKQFSPNLYKVAREESPWLQKWHCLGFDHFRRRYLVVLSCRRNGVFWFNDHGFVYCGAWIFAATNCRKPSGDCNG